MSQQDPMSPGQPAASTTPPTGGPANQPPPPPAQTHPPEEAPAEQRRVKGTTDDPLRGSAASHVWILVVLMVILLVLLAVFILQNLASVQVNYFGATGSSPLAVALLLAFAAGLAVAGLAGTLRILQLRRRVKKLNR